MFKTHISTSSIDRYSRHFTYFLVPRKLNYPWDLEKKKKIGPKFACSKDVSRHSLSIGIGPILAFR